MTRTSVARLWSASEVERPECVRARRAQPATQVPTRSSRSRKAEHYAHVSHRLRATCVQDRDGWRAGTPIRACRHGDDQGPALVLAVVPEFRINAAYSPVADQPAARDAL